MRTVTILLLVVTAAFLGLLVWWSSDGPEPDTTASKIPKKSESAQVASQAPRSTDQRAAGNHPPAGGDKRNLLTEHEQHAAKESKEPKLPAPFVATRIGKDAIAVRISGGEALFDSVLDSVEYLDRDATRDEGADEVNGCSVHGIVSDEHGRVSGAIVLAGKNLDNVFGHLIGTSSSQSDERGWFELPLKCGQANNLVAMHRKFGWSKTTVVSVEQGSTRLDIQLQKAGSIAGKVTRGGLPELALLRIASEDTVLELDTKSKQDGTYLFGSIPPGKYELSCGISVIGSRGNVPAYRRAKVEVPSGGGVSLDIELGDGTLVVVNLKTLADDVDVALIHLALLNPELPYSTADEVLAYLKTKAGRESHQTLIGGSSIAVPIQFHSIEPGSYRLCAVARHENPHRLVCQPITVHDYQSVVEASIEI